MRNNTIIIPLILLIIWENIFSCPFCQSPSGFAYKVSTAILAGTILTLGIILFLIFRKFAYLDKEKTKKKIKTDQ